MISSQTSASTACAVRNTSRSLTAVSACAPEGGSSRPRYSSKAALSTATSAGISAAVASRSIMSFILGVLSLQPYRAYLPDIDRPQLGRAALREERDAQAVGPGWVDPARQTHVVVGEHLDHRAIDEDMQPQRLAVGQFQHAALHVVLILG